MLLRNWLAQNLFFFFLPTVVNASQLGIFSGYVAIVKHRTGMTTCDYVTGSLKTSYFFKGVTHPLQEAILTGYVAQMKKTHRHDYMFLCYLLHQNLFSKNRGRRIVASNNFRICRNRVTPNWPMTVTRIDLTQSTFHYRIPAGCPTARVSSVHHWLLSSSSPRRGWSHQGDRSIRRLRHCHIAMTCRGYYWGRLAKNGIFISRTLINTTVSSELP